MKLSLHVSLVALAALAVPSAVTAAGLSLNGTVTPPRGSLLYQLSVFNSGAEDYILVSIVDAPVADPLIGPGLTTPAGFLGSYDSGLGIIDFLADLEIFAAGTEKGVFSFESLSTPGGFFTQVEAYTDQLGLVSGDISWTLIPGTSVPEPGGGLLSILALGLLRLGLSPPGHGRSRLFEEGR